MLRRVFLMGFLVLSLTACQAPDIDQTALSGTSGQTTVFLVRHAEKQKGPDPSLTEKGAKRAEALGVRLQGEALTKIYSTDYARTRETATAVSDGTGVKVSLYDPSDLPAFAEELKSMSGSILVVGHSNTTPALVSMLGGDAGTPIDDATEFNRLYTVTISDGSVLTLQERYGD